MLSLHTNNAALSAQNSISRTQSSLSTSMTRLSTGYRINSAMDDAAGLQIASRLKAQTSGMTVAMRNTQNSTSMLQTAEGALDEVSNMLVRMKDLATQAADASSTADDKDAMQSEYDALGTELGNVLKNTTFGGTKLLVGGTIASSMTFQIGASSSETMAVNLGTDVSQVVSDVTAVTTKYATTAVGTELTASANATIGTLETALASVNKVRSGLGAAANRLEHVYNNLSNISTNSKAAAGLIMDVDFATESANMTSSQMLLQAGTAMLKQSNSMSSMVMSLLQ
ncbi:flagellin N-terminal helical domain-containing protein [Telluria aromaticivorans]|uniref:Flagellin n=1 Tax=Telluria aromaticivorans TaxID=2725995 RepID=A0A7Y2K0J7_9BURK|nr:flagellin [Telluria aromaticivorans]NNG24336.1 Lateral flagellin [Telluria aromaticivorans]